MDLSTWHGSWRFAVNLNNLRLTLFLTPCVKTHAGLKAAEKSVNWGKTHDLCTFYVHDAARAFAEATTVAFVELSFFPNTGVIKRIVSLQVSQQYPIRCIPQESPDLFSTKVFAGCFKKLL
jgi:hypothetical protein